MLGGHCGQAFAWAEGPERGGLGCGAETGGGGQKPV